MKRVFRACAITSILFSLAGGGGAAAQDTAPQVTRLDVAGVVDPFMASYVKAGIEKANEEHRAAILVVIDTPGGLISSERAITQAILDSEVPVISYVYPPGARAASAGTFILMAGSIAAMAPGTNVGAAHPVGVSGVIEQDKVTNDAAASIRSIAQARDRNADWAERAVRDSVSISAEEALQENVIDIVSPDIEGLLNELDGRQVPVAHDRSAVLGTAGAVVTTASMNPFAYFLHTLLNPDIAFVFFWFGLGLIILEIFLPGGIVGTIGAVMLVLAIAAFGMLPVQTLGIGLLMVSVVAFVVELKHPGMGLPAIVGAATLIAGGLFLYDPSVPGARVSFWVLIPMAGAVTAFFAIVIQAAMRLRMAPPADYKPSLVGREGEVLRALKPAGVIRLSAEEWTAYTAEGHIPKGTPVRVAAVEGLKLRVEPVTTETPTAGTSTAEATQATEEGA